MKTGEDAVWTDTARPSQRLVGGWGWRTGGGGGSYQSPGSLSSSPLWTSVVDMVK